MTGEPGGTLPLLNKLLYTSDMIGSQAMAQTRNLWLFFFLVTPSKEGLSAPIPSLDLGLFHVDPALFAGFLLTAGRIVEALDDPIIGWWSDRTRSRWGRRIPFVLFSTPFYALFFSLLWLMPGGDGGVVNAVYILIVLELFFLANTLSGGPYEALLPEVAHSHRDRMSIVAWQLYFGLLGAALAFSLSGPVKDAFDFKVMGAIVAVLGLLFRYIGLGGIWRRAPRETPAAQIGLAAALISTLQNRQFLYFLPTFVLFQLAVGMLTAWLPFFVVAVLGSLRLWNWVPLLGGKTLGGGASTSLLAVAAVLGMAVGAFVLWKLSDRRTKRLVYSFSLLGTAVYLPLFFFAGFVPGVPKVAQAMVMAFLVGFPMAGVNLLPKAITADITDYDELRTGMRREGMFYATQNLFEKIGSSFAPLVLGAVFLLGRTADDPLGIRMMGPVAGIIAFFGFWLFRGYRLPSTVTRETVEAAGL
jgi:GPH family glycoside/pentoside/hexuronide:cation symporter